MRHHHMIKEGEVNNTHLKLVFILDDCHLKKKWTKVQADAEVIWNTVWPSKCLIWKYGQKTNQINRHV